jgi:hypothetical protein
VEKTCKLEEQKDLPVDWSRLEESFDTANRIGDVVSEM